MAAPVFGVFFTGHSYPITNVQAFQQASPTQWVLNVSSTVTPQFLDLKEVALFLTAPNLLPPDVALSLVRIGGGPAQGSYSLHGFTRWEEEALLRLISLSSAGLRLVQYVSVGGAAWSYRGCVHAGHPSDVFPLSWAVPPDGAALAGQVAQVGVSLEPLSEAVEKEGSKLGAKEDFAKMVGASVCRGGKGKGGAMRFARCSTCCGRVQSIKRWANLLLHHTPPPTEPPAAGGGCRWG